MDGRNHSPADEHVAQNDHNAHGAQNDHGAPSRPRRGSRRRDRNRTEQRLIHAVLQLVREQGFDAVGINAIAEAAGVSKVLIYRYFGDLSGLLQAVAEEISVIDPQLASSLRGTAPPDATPADVMYRAALALRNVVKNDDLVRNLLVWELSHDNELTQALSENRERVGMDQTRQFQQFLKEHRPEDDLDVEALLALVTAGVFHLSLRAERCSVFNGVDISSDAGWERIAAVLRELLRRTP